MTFVNLISIKMANYLLPNRLYFTFSSFLFDERSILKLNAIIIKLALPFLVAFVATAVLYWVRNARRSLVGESRVIDQIMREQLTMTVSFAAFLTAFLLAWPYILLWDLLIDPKIASQRLIFLFAYFAYFVGYAFFARAGAETAIVLFDDGQKSTTVSLVNVSEHPFVKPVVTAVGGAISSAIAAFLVATPE
jgi:hypothetical protein